MDDKNKKPASPWTKSLLIWVGVLFGLVLFAQMLGGGTQAQAGNPIAYSDFVRQANWPAARTSAPRRRPTRR